MEFDESGSHDGTPTEARLRAGIEPYHRRMLAVYDWLVLGLVCRWVWRCPRSKMLAQYNSHVGARHLDLGPGTGWFLDECRFPTANPAITLVDLSDGVLAGTARRISRYRPVTRTANVLEPLDLGAVQFDSVGMNFLLHCLPGPLDRKAAVFDSVIPYLADNARIFGSTVLGADERHTAVSRALQRRLNRADSFSNETDRAEDLARALAARFTEVEISRSGVVCLFAARYPGGVS
ncbi:class I SAM-dependent methyltransferase [Nocardia sp. BMG51109]|uniref:class I SAM-dependent methyltransferase n=1 Tax=Nocardia sp. BMG51109 TaxID=1056816 RepID=UPI0004639783|nr:class I SAM-dependent methyltransferase [Nocardia sp. BMG51109]